MTIHLLDFDTTSAFLGSGIFYSLEEETSANVSLTAVTQIIPEFQVEKLTMLHALYNQLDSSL